MGTGRPRVRRPGPFPGRTLLVLAALTGALVLARPVLGPTVADVIADAVATDAPPGGLVPATRVALLEAARAHAQRRAVSRPVGPPQHAHDSVTVDQLLAALQSDADSIEGDLGLTGTRVVMRHQAPDAVELTLEDWLEIVAAAEFATIKLDIKRDRVTPIIRALTLALERYRIPQERLKINADVFDGPGARSGMSLLERAYVALAVALEPDDLEAFARAFPGATVSISAVLGREPGAPAYDGHHVARVRSLVSAMRAAGAANVVVVARWDLLTPEFVSAMTVAGAPIDVWNSLTAAPPPTDPREEASALRARYGDALGVIDLRR